jgi:hypothetical protein
LAWLGLAWRIIRNAANHDVKHFFRNLKADFIIQPIECIVLIGLSPSDSKSEKGPSSISPKHFSNSSKSSLDGTFIPPQPESVRCPFSATD